MSFPIDAGGTNPLSTTATYRPPTPIVLDESTRSLWNRAISDPSSLTDQERRLITHRIPQDEEDTLCRNACGLFMSELVTKAINSSSNDGNDDDNDGLPLSSLSLGLSHKEATLILAGVVKGQPRLILSEVARLSPEDRDLKARAMEAATTDEMRAATKVARKVQQRWRDVQNAAAEALNVNHYDIRNIWFVINVPWQDHVLQSSSAGGRFGLVLFYPQDEEAQGGRLPEFKTLIGTAVHHGLHYSPSLIKDETRDRFTLHWVAVPGSNNGMDPSELRKRFSTMLSNSDIPAGFRRDGFLYLDDEALSSRETTRPYLWFAEPEPLSESKTGPGAGPVPETVEMPAALQPLKVDIKHIAPALFARLVQRDLQGEARRKPYWFTSELERLHAAANSRHRDEKDGIWPPATRLQKLNLLQAKSYYYQQPNADIITRIQTRTVPI